ncbi:MAG: copper chaperone PCu(A)C [Parvibaculum sp.]|jgi:copper(I)-binding protein|uniref:copper chaperone PCu(A)C n=1 Tax=Parvibaculum sp. TaxID=2024848 RepID=UPI002C8B8375|nr:copper chaperone PCu(A)C [Hyphomicrobium sp.]
MKLVKTLALGLILNAAAQGVLAHDYEAGPLAIDHPWARATPPGAPVAGGYLTITNTGTEPDRLLGGSSDAAEAVEIHESTITDGVARMRSAEDGIAIAPGETLRLEPGAVHIMFVDPAKPLKDGERFPATLIFEKAGDVAVEFAIMPMGATPEAPQNHEGHGAPVSQ